MNFEKEIKILATAEAIIYFIPALIIIGLITFLPFLL